MEKINEEHQLCNTRSEITSEDAEWKALSDQGKSIITNF